LPAEFLVMRMGWLVHLQKSMAVAGPEMNLFKKTNKTITSRSLHSSEAEVASNVGAG
jgi:hypothetical protein